MNMSLPKSQKQQVQMIAAGAIHSHNLSVVLNNEDGGLD